MAKRSINEDEYNQETVAELENHKDLLLQYILKNRGEHTTSNVSMSYNHCLCLMSDNTLSMTYVLATWYGRHAS